MTAIDATNEGSGVIHRHGQAADQAGGDCVPGTGLLPGDSAVSGTAHQGVV